MTSVINRFLKYVSFDTKSNEDSPTCPSTSGQKVLGAALVEEMLARLLQLLICTISPARIDLHADFWNDRLITRLTFNLGTKLRGVALPQMHFATITAEKLAGKLYRAATAI